MSNELYSLASLRQFCQQLASMVNVAFPQRDMRVGILEGGWTNDKPWVIVLAPTGELRSKFYDCDHVEATIMPQTFLDQVDHGGIVSVPEYAAGVFVQLMGRLVVAARNQNDMLAYINENMRREAAARGIPMPELGSDAGPSVGTDRTTDSGIILPS